MRCPYCGERNSQDDRRCRNCGRKLPRSRQQKKERNIVATGVVLILLILAAGVGAMLAISSFLDDEAPDVTESKVTIMTTPTPTPTQPPVVQTSSASAGDENGSEESSSSGSDSASETDIPLTAQLSDRQSQIDLMGYSPLNVVNAEASSTIQQYGVDNSPSVMFDGSDATSWQEGVSGDGVGETVKLDFGGQHTIRFLTMKLGNWRSNTSYEKNGRPQTLSFTAGDEHFTVEFPDEQKEYCIELSKDIEASDLEIRIDKVYSGSAYADTCITEMTVFGY